MYTLPTALFVWALCHIGSVNGYVKPREDPTGVDSAERAVVMPVLTFNSIPDMTTCQTATMSWMYAPVTNDDPPYELTLNITNIGVAQLSLSATSTGSFATPNPRAIYRRDELSQQITSGPIDPQTRFYLWPSVDVTAGSYVITATLNLPGFLEESQSFLVHNGPDTSCLAGTQPSSSVASSSTPSNPTSSGSPTSTGGASASSGAVTLPVTSGSSSKVNRGAIAGGVIGGLAVVAAAIAAYFYLKYASASATSRGSHRNQAPRKWAGLGSTDSKAKMYPPASRSAGAPSGRHHSQSDSIGPMLSSHDSNVYVIGSVGIDSRPSRINDAHALEEEDEVNSYFSPSQEKISSPPNGSPLRSPFSESGHGHDDDAVPLDFIAPLPGNAAVTRNSSTSTSSYMNNFSRPRSHPSSPYSSPTIGEGPFSDNARNTTSSSLAHESSYPPSPSPAFPSGTSQAFSESPPPRRGSAGEPIAAPTRRTPRKPVPQYNPTDPTLASPPPSMPSPLAPVHDSDSSREGSMRGGRMGIGAQDLPSLHHKGSFGDGRPVHYLIPDMPPPQRD